MPATDKAPAVHEYVAQRIPRWRQGVASKLVEALFDTYPLPENVDLISSVNPEIKGDLPFSQ